MICICVQISPELDQEESVGRALGVELLQPVRLLGELVLDLADIQRLKNDSSC